MNKNYFILLICLCFSIALRGQQKSTCKALLKLIDANTNEIIVGAQIKLESNPAYFLSDSNGLAEIPGDCGTNTILIQYFGYRNYVSKVELTRSAKITIRLESNASQLEEVVISSQADNRNIESPALGVNILNVKAVQKLPPAAGEVDVIRSLQTLPGITTVGEGANGYNVRGGAVDQNLILIDNMPIFNPTHMLGLFSLFPTDGIREMQMYKGSIPAKYGGRTASVLDVKLSEPSKDNFSLKGGIGMISNRLSADIPIVQHKLGLFTSNRFSFNDFLIKAYNSKFFTNFRKRKLPDARPTFYDFTNKLVWRPNTKDNISLSSYIGYDSYRIDSIFSIAGIVPKQSTIQYGHISGALRWNHYFNPDYNNNLLIVHSRYNTNTESNENKTGFKFDTHLYYTSIQDEVTYTPTKNQRMIAGASIAQYNLSPGDLDPKDGSSVSTLHLNKEKSIEAAAYLSDEYEVNDRLLIDAGIRIVNYANLGPTNVVEYNEGQPYSINSIKDTLAIDNYSIENNFLKLEPRLGIRYKLNDLTAIKFGYNRMNQFMQMFTNLTTPLPNVRWKSSNRYIKPITSDFVSLGLFKNTPDAKWEWSIEGYYRKQANVSDFINGAELTISNVLETQIVQGNSRSYGAELLINKKKGVMTGWLSYTYSKSTQQILGPYPALQQINSGQWFPANIDKPHNLNLVMNIQSEKHNMISFTYQYSSGRPYTAPVSFYKSGFKYIPIYTDRNNGRISPYSRLDFAWTIINPSTRKSRWEGSWVITIYNLLGRKNAFSYYFDPNQNSFKPFKVSVFSLPIFSLTYNTTFK